MGIQAFFRSLTLLREYGIRVLYEPETYPPKLQVLPEIILQALEEVLPPISSQRPESAIADDESS
jgi:hypothetical protein